MRKTQTQSKQYNEFVWMLKRHCFDGQHPDQAQIQFQYYMVHFPFEKWLQYSRERELELKGATV